jgi:hypothetical protein
MNIMPYCSYLLSDLGENRHHYVTLFSFNEFRETGAAMAVLYLRT